MTKKGEGEKGTQDKEGEKAKGGDWPIRTWTVERRRIQNYMFWHVLFTLSVLIRLILPVRMARAFHVEGIQGIRDECELNSIRNWIWLKIVNWIWSNIVTESDQISWTEFDRNRELYSGILRFHFHFGTFGLGQNPEFWKITTFKDGVICGITRCIAECKLLWTIPFCRIVLI